MVLYRPQHAVSMAFHKSNALVRRFRSGKRCSKTQSALAEVRWTAIGQHPYRKTTAVPCQIFLVGSDYAHYAPMVFEPKYINGEPGNPLSPMFPEGGKWLYKYDDRKHIIDLACRDCAEKKQAQSCRHQKTRIILFSDELNAKALEGAQYGLGHLDEIVGRDFYSVGRERIKTVPKSGLILTYSPDAGEAYWAEVDLGPVEQRRDTVGKTDQLVAELFTINQFSAGLADHDMIRASMIDKTESEVQSHIFGIPATSSEFAIFDLEVLREMSNEIAEPKRGALVLRRNEETTDKTDEEILTTALADAPPKVLFQPRKDGMLRVWQPPKKLGQYVIGVDVSQGLTRRDASVASVMRMFPTGLDIEFDMVAQYHGWVDSLLYAVEIMKLGLLYYPATLVIERNGPGDAVIQKLKDMGCWFLFHDVSAISSYDMNFASLYGVTTNQQTKSIIISMLQSVFKLNRLGKDAIHIPCADTIRELKAYVQKPTESGRSFRFEADGTEHDDRVMSLALALYAAKTSPLYDFEHEKRVKAELAAGSDTRDAYSKKFWSDIRAEQERNEKFAQVQRMELESEFATEGDAEW